MADTGRIAGSLLLEKELASEFGLLVRPVIVGERAYGIFGNVSKSINLKLHRKLIQDSEEACALKILEGECDASLA